MITVPAGFLLPGGPHCDSDIIIKPLASGVIVQLSQPEDSHSSPSQRPRAPSQCTAGITAPQGGMPCTRRRSAAGLVSREQDRGGDVSFQEPAGADPRPGA
jgi:hypothetical protein